MQAANSEIGTIQHITKLSEIAQRKGAFIHCDASQALGKIPIKVDELGIDFLSLSGHKIYGPKGIGIIWIKSGYQATLKPLLYGGNHLRGIRPGTLPVPLIVGLGVACELVENNFFTELERIKTCETYLRPK